MLHYSATLSPEQLVFLVITFSFKVWAGDALGLFHSSCPNEPQRRRIRSD
jgi:hypothetical protein